MRSVRKGVDNLEWNWRLFFKKSYKTWTPESVAFGFLWKSFWPIYISQISSLTRFRHWNLTFHLALYPPPLLPVPSSSHSPLFSGPSSIDPPSHRTTYYRKLKDTSIISTWTPKTLLEIRKFGLSFTVLLLLWRRSDVEDPIWSTSQITTICIGFLDGIMKGWRVR